MEWEDYAKVVVSRLKKIKDEINKKEDRTNELRFYHAGQIDIIDKVITTLEEKP